jgi:hypothetical protein
MKDIKNFILESSQDDLEDMTNDLSEWWDEHCVEDGYNSRHEFMDDMKAMADKENDPLVDDAFDYLENECEWDRKDIEHWEDDLIEVLSQWAKDQLSY